MLPLHGLPRPFKIFIGQELPEICISTGNVFVKQSEKFFAEFLKEILSKGIFIYFDTSLNSVCKIMCWILYFTLWVTMVSIYFYLWGR